MIVVIAFYVVGLGAGWPAQEAVLLALSVVATFLCYEVVRRVPWLRFLFGMRPRRRGALSPASPTGTGAGPLAPEAAAPADRRG